MPHYLYNALDLCKSKKITLSEFLLLLHHRQSPHISTFSCFSFSFFYDTQNLLSLCIDELQGVNVQNITCSNELIYAYICIIDIIFSECHIFLQQNNASTLNNVCATQLNENSNGTTSREKMLTESINLFYTYGNAIGDIIAKLLESNNVIWIVKIAVLSAAEKVCKCILEDENLNKKKNNLITKILVKIVTFSKNVSINVDEAHQKFFIVQDTVSEILSNLILNKKVFFLKRQSKFFFDEFFRIAKHPNHKISFRGRVCLLRFLELLDSEAFLEIQNNQIKQIQSLISSIICDSFPSFSLCYTHILLSRCLQIMISVYLYTFPNVYDSKNKVIMNDNGANSNNNKNYDMCEFILGNKNEEQGVKNQFKVVVNKNNNILLKCIHSIVKKTYEDINSFNTYVINKEKIFLYLNNISLNSSNNDLSATDVLLNKPKKRKIDFYDLQKENNTEEKEKKSSSKNNMKAIYQKMANDAIKKNLKTIKEVKKEYLCSEKHAKQMSTHYGFVLANIILHNMSCSENLIYGNVIYDLTKQIFFLDKTNISSSGSYVYLWIEEMKTYIKNLVYSHKYLHLKIYKHIMNFCLHVLNSYVLYMYDVLLNVYMYKHNSLPQNFYYSKRLNALLSLTFEKKKENVFERNSKLFSFDFTERNSIVKSWSNLCDILTILILHSDGFDSANRMAMLGKIDEFILRIIFFGLKEGEACNEVCRLVVTNSRALYASLKLLHTSINYSRVFSLSRVTRGIILILNKLSVFLEIEEKNERLIWQEEGAEGEWNEGKEWKEDEEDSCIYNRNCYSKKQNIYDIYMTKCKMFIEVILNALHQKIGMALLMQHNSENDTDSISHKETFVDKFEKIFQRSTEKILNERKFFENIFRKRPLINDSNNNNISRTNADSIHDITFCEKKEIYNNNSKNTKNFGSSSVFLNNEITEENTSLENKERMKKKTKKEGNDENEQKLSFEVKKEKKELQKNEEGEFLEDEFLDEDELLDEKLLEEEEEFLEEDEAFEEEGALEDEEGALEDEDGALEDEDGALEDEDGALEDEDGALEDEDGALEDEDGALEDENGALEDEDGALEDEDGALEDEEDFLEEEDLEDEEDFVEEEDLEDEEDLEEEEFFEAEQLEEEWVKQDNQDLFRKEEEKDLGNEEAEIVRSKSYSSNKYENVCVNKRNTNNCNKYESCNNSMNALARQCEENEEQSKKNNFEAKNVFDTVDLVSSDEEELTEKNKEKERNDSSNNVVNYQKDEDNRTLLKRKDEDSDDSTREERARSSNIESIVKDENNSFLEPFEVSQENLSRSKSKEMNNENKNKIEAFDVMSQSTNKSLSSSNFLSFDSSSMHFTSRDFLCSSTAFSSLPSGQITTLSSSGSQSNTSFSSSSSTSSNSLTLQENSKCGILNNTNKKDAKREEVEHESKTGKKDGHINDLHNSVQLSSPSPISSFGLCSMSVSKIEECFERMQQNLVKKQKSDMDESNFDLKFKNC